jgi:predicted nucleic acid-binding protein
MIVLCDTSIYVALLRGTLSVREFAELAPGVPQLSPVVASELLRGVKKPGPSRRLGDLIGKMTPAEPKSWRAAWLETGRLLPQIFQDHEEIGLARLQNDCLIALTSRDTGALLVAADGHFASLQKRIPFSLKLVKW